MAGEHDMKMRDLEERTGVNRETIRVYLRHGLMPEPYRPKTNVADYGEEHVESIQAIRSLQEERRLPLHMIKRAMEGDTSAIGADAGAFPHLDRLVAARVGIDDTLIPLSATNKCNPIAEADVVALGSIGAIKIIRRRNKVYLSRIDAEIVGVWGSMRAAGFTEELGFNVQDCRQHVEAAEELAHYEISTFLHRLDGKQTEGPAADMAQAALTNLLNFFGLVRTKTVLADLRSQSGKKARPKPTARKSTSTQ